MRRLRSLPLVLVLGACSLGWAGVGPTLAGGADHAPEIVGVSPDRDRVSGGAEVVVDGRNFAAGLQITLGDVVVTDVTLESDSRVRFRVPPQPVAGGRTLTIRTSGGVDQALFHVLPKTLDEMGDGEIATIAGGVEYVGDGGLATAPDVLLAPADVVAGRSGDVFISDQSQHRVRRLDLATGRITTYAGSGTPGLAGDGGPATAASLDRPAGLAVDGEGNLLIADSGNSRVRRVDAATGVITTLVSETYGVSDIALTPSGFLYYSEFSGIGPVQTGVHRVDVATGESVQLPYGGANAIALDAAGNVYLAAFDGNTGSLGIVRVDDRTGDFAEIVQEPATDVDVDEDGNLFFATFDSRVKRWDAVTGAITVVAGNGSHGFDGDGGPATEAMLNYPVGVAWLAGELFVADLGSARLRRVDRRGIIETVAGSGNLWVLGDGGPATSAHLEPGPIAADRLHRVYVGDASGRVRRIDAVSGTIATIAGGGPGGLDGPATDAALGPIGSVAVDAHANVFLTEYVAASNTVRLLRVDAESGVITFVREDAFGSLAVRRQSLYFSESTPGVYQPSTRVFRLDLRTNDVSTFAGGGTRTGGGPATRVMLHTDSISVNRAGDVFGVSGWRVWKIAAGTGFLRFVAGTPDGSGQFLEGVGPFVPGFVAAGSASVFVTTFAWSPGGVYSNAVLRVDAESPGRLKRVAGQVFDVNYSGDGGPATEAGLSASGPIAADTDDNLYVFDDGKRIRIVKRPR